MHIKDGSGSCETEKTSEREGAEKIKRIKRMEKCTRQR